MKSKITSTPKRIIIMMIVLLCVSTVVIFSSLDIPYDVPAYSKVVGEYDVSRMNTDFGGGQAYAIGVNAKGKPIFKNPEKALQQALIDYHAGFEAIKEEYHLWPASRLLWKSYHAYGWQLTTENKNIQLQGLQISKFFDIYENSFQTSD